MKCAYKFPAVKGIQASKDYYIVMIPLKMLACLFPSDDEYVSPEYRAQRRLNETRIPIISRYILDNRDSYVFSALAASIDGEYKFYPAPSVPDAGVLEISTDAKFLINDGQHRKSAILKALRIDESLGDETIPVVFFSDMGLERSQQIFTDLNKNAIKTSNSISELYDSRDQMAIITRRVIGKIDFLNTYTDKEKDILGKFSLSLFTLNTFYMANKVITGGSLEKDAEAFILRFWTSVSLHMVQWRELEHKEITKIDLRENYIATQSIVIQALGRVGNYLYRHPEVDVDAVLSGLEQISWNRKSPQWYMRAINRSERIITNKRAALLIANIIKKHLGLPLLDDEVVAENQLSKTLSE